LLNDLSFGKTLRKCEDKQESRQLGTAKIVSVGLTLTLLRQIEAEVNLVRNQINPETVPTSSI
jgi:hypothetical protein